MNGRTIKVGSAGTAAKTVELRCDEVYTFGQVIEMAGMNPEGKIVTHSGTVKADQVIPDDVTVIGLSAPKLAAGACDHVVTVGRAGSPAVKVTLLGEEVYTFERVIAMAGMNPEGKIVTHAGTVEADQVIPDDVTVIGLSAPKLAAGI